MRNHGGGSARPFLSGGGALPHRLESLKGPGPLENSNVTPISEAWG
jgi:hypothetical protein